MPLTIFDEITEADLQNLIDNTVLERKTLEYKRILPGNSDGDKKEFLSDIVSFANAIGGDIIYGITEDDNHVPSSLDGIEATDGDELILRLDGIIRDGVQPRIPNIHIRTIPLRNGRIATLIRIPKSWLNPHMVTYRGSSRFYTRASNGKYQMDISEIRSAITLSESRIQRIKEFVQSRISDIYSDNAQVPLTNFPKIALHIIPFSSVDTQIVENFERLQMMPVIPMFTGGANSAFNADGYISYSTDPNGVSKGYVQIYRNGNIEAVSSFLSERDHQTTLPITYIELGIIGALKNYSNFLRILSVEPPAFIFITLMKVKGLVRPESRGYTRGEGIPIQKDIIFLPNFELKIFGLMEDQADLEQLTRSLKLSFDALSNSVGLSRSSSYNDQGEWVR
jgi:hypothetical protein